MLHANLVINNVINRADAVLQKGLQLQIEEAGNTSNEPPFQTMVAADYLPAPTCFEENFCQHESCHRRELGGFRYDGIAVNERRREFERQKIQREVPWCYDGNHADR